MMLLFVQNRDALLPLIFSFAVECAIRKVKENQMGLKLNGAHQLLFYADDVNLLGDNIDTINKSSKTLVDDSKEVGLEINVEKTKYMLYIGITSVRNKVFFSPGFYFAFLTLHVSAPFGGHLQMVRKHKKYSIFN
jgi:hypothetical protein